MSRPVTVFNVRKEPVKVSVAGNRVPGRFQATVNADDPVCKAALDRGDLVLLSDAVPAPPPAQPEAAPAPEGTPTEIPPTGDEIPAWDEESEVGSEEPKKKTPKAKES